MKDGFLVSIITATVMTAGLATQSAHAAAPTGTFTNAFCNAYPGTQASFIFLLTDGTIMVHDTGNQSQQFYRLTPDNTGSYLCGTWTALASIPNSFSYGPKFYGSALLPDGRLLIMGGEYNLNGPQVEINKGAIYLPTTNQWLPVRPPTGWTTIGDAQTVVLPSGQLMLANCCSTQQALFNPSNLTWTPTGSAFTGFTNNEAGWSLLPDGTVLGVLNNAGSGPQLAQRWIMGTSTVCPPPPQTTGTFVGTWCSAGNVGQQLFDTAQEMGPTLLLNNGTVLAIGATGNVSVYTPPPVTVPPSTLPGSWANSTKLPAGCGPTTPGPANLQCASTDSPATMLPSGNVLLVACPVAAGANEFPPGFHFFEYDITQNPPTWNEPTYPAALRTQLDSDGCGFLARMISLPNGHVIYTNGSTALWEYTPAGSPNPAWAPSITSFPSVINRNQTYNITGLLFNGMTQANAFGDDVENATNYPIIQVTMNAAPNHVYYGRTHDHSAMGVARTTLPVTTKFELWDCAHQIAGSACVAETGQATLRVIANGIASPGVLVSIN
jgi:hypothetical protein